MNPITKGSPKSGLVLLPKLVLLALGGTLKGVRLPGSRFYWATLTGKLG